VRGIGFVCGWFRPREWNAKANWYDTTTNHANFLILDNPRGIGTWAAVAQFGAPSRQVHIDRYTVLVWNHDILPAVVFHAGCAG
jgi:hypothetical protein